MFVTLKANRPFRNGANKAKQEMVNMGPGRFEIVFASNPVDSEGEPWYVFKDSLLGAPISWWYRFAKPEWKKMQIVIER